MVSQETKNKEKIKAKAFVVDSMGRKWCNRVKSQGLASFSMLGRLRGTEAVPTCLVSGPLVCD